MMIRIEASGLDRVVRTLARGAQPAGLDAALRLAAETVRQAALDALSDGQAPQTRTGALAASLTVTSLPQGDGYAVSSDAPQAAALEFGTLRQPARPWFLPAAQSALPAINRLLPTLIGR